LTNSLSKEDNEKIGSEGRKISNKTAQDTKRNYSTVKKLIKELVDTFFRRRAGRDFCEYV